MTVPDFEEFLSTHFEGVRRALCLVVGDPEQAGELTQEAFARAWARWPAVAAMDRPVTWVYVVAVNHARREWRRHERAGAAAPTGPIRDHSGAVVTAVTLRTALATLPPRQRAAVVLRYLADLSTAEVAQAMRCAEGTVKSTLHAALAHLRVDLEEGEV